jgi:polyribonucleotide nucleotidyltransferase
MSHKVEFELGGRTLTIETGKIAKQSNGAVTVRYGDSMVVSTICSQPEPRLGFDFFPLTVEYREKTYAAGKIPGGFFRREGRPSEKEILSARIIDRTIRPLFPSDFKGETQCINFILSHDQENDTDLLALIGTSAAIAVSDVPFEKTVAGVRVGRIDGELIINPTFAQIEEGDLNVIVAGSADSIAMVEGAGYEITEEELIKVLSFAHDNIKIIVAEIEKLQKECGKPKFEHISTAVDETLTNKVKELVGDKLDGFNHTADKDERRDGKKQLKAEIVEQLAEEFPESDSDIGTIIHDLDSESMRDMILKEDSRIDNRKPDDIRDITCEVGLLPRTHGSALFTRGQTQAIVAITLGTKMDEQRMDELEGESTKSYMLHYNFPPFSTGEAKPIRGTSRREVGHGALAERALVPVIPAETSFPYTLRVVSDIMESNGSSSMASVCGASLALMDAGVPIKTAVAGIAMGLIKADDKVVILTDILGDEDHFGDMDFKITGTTEGVTAVQMDIKIDGLDIETMRMALDKAREARLSILENMNATISKNREQLSQYAPRIITIKISPSKIGELIGPGGKNIRAICEETGAKIDIEDDGTVLISSVDGEAGQKAKERVEICTEEAEVGKVYSGLVRRIAPFGAFLEIIPGTDGMLHISEIDHSHVKRVEDYMKLGDRLDVKVVSIDNEGKIRLSRKVLLEGNGGGDQSQSRERSR